MSPSSARRFLVTCALSAASMAVLVTPGVASAEVTKCEGAKVKGQGSSLQKLAQNTVWRPPFNTSCAGKKAEVEEYNPSGSGAGLKSWGAGGVGEYGPSNAYVGTDQPPNAAQKKEIEEGEGRKNPGTLQTIPVLQAAVAIIVHLPAGCTATSTAAPGRLVLKQTTLEKIFRGTLTEWGKIKDDGDKFIGASCEILKKGAKVHITRVARADGSGTTATFKKFLFLKTKSAVDGTKTWNELAEENPNTLWPNEGTDKVEKFAKGSGVVAGVAGLAGSVGYANLADARVAAFTPPAGGEGKEVFWTEIENGKETYSDPSTDKETSATATKANCEETLYTNGKKKFPPPKTSEVWNEVNSSTKEKNYVICGFTYDLSMSQFSLYAGTTEEEARTVFDYLEFELSTAAGGGQTLINENRDYLKLPESAVKGQNVRKIASEGAEKVTFNGALFKP